MRGWHREAVRGLFQKNMVRMSKVNEGYGISQGIIRSLGRFARRYGYIVLMKFRGAQGLLIHCFGTAKVAQIAQVSWMSRG